MVWPTQAMLMSRQVTSQLQALPHSTPELQAPIPHDTSHGPDPQVTGDAQLLSAQSTVHVLDMEQSTPAPQVSAPHRTSHGPAPHWTGFAHELLPLQVTSQADAVRQSTPARQLRDPHATRHGMPAGQITALVHELAAEQSITHTPLGSHVPLVHAS